MEVVNATDLIRLPSRYAPTILWNGGDTIIVGISVSDVGVNKISGQISIYRKTLGEWTLNKIITSQDMGLSAPGGLGVGLLLIDADTFIVHAVDSFNRTRVGVGGTSFLLRRINGDWMFTHKIVQKTADSYLTGPSSYDPTDQRLYFFACTTKVINNRLYE